MGNCQHIYRKQHPTVTFENSRKQDARQPRRRFERESRFSLEAPRTMNRLFSIVVGIFALGLVVWAQQTPSATPTMPGATGSTSQPEADTASPHQSARSFEGRITKSGGRLVLEDRAAHTSYPLDEQDKARKYLGKNVKVMATMDARSNLLHVIDIVPNSENR
jgi:Protein of unknown function (DUF5818)